MNMWTIEEQEKKNRRILVVAFVTLQILSLVSATSRTLVPNDAAHQDNKSMKEGVVINEEAYKMLSTLGSRPPNCEHKCGGCVPCEATQVPTTTDRLGVQYANYEPEGWKCKCGTTFYNP